MDSLYSFCIPKQKGGLAMVELIFFTEWRQVLPFTYSRRVKNTKKFSGLSTMDDQVAY